jgi:EmrB/QacA subfamily drug resistance transporter
MPPEATARGAVGLSHREIMGVIGGILLGMLLAALDQTVVATALPAMAADLNGIEHLSWIVTAYLLTSTASTPIYGKLSDLYGRRRLLEAAIILFVIASALCAAAQTMGQLVVARALQGLGGGGLMSMAQAVIADVISPRERGRYQGYFSAVWGLASVGGPVMGGFFVQYLSWRWVFWINLPLGALAFVLCHRALASLVVRRARRHIDVLGAGFLITAVTSLLLVASWGGTEMPWTSSTILGLLAAGLVLGAAFILQELRAPEAILPPRLFSNRVIAVANLISAIVSMPVFGGAMLLPVFFQLVDGMSPSNSGLLLAPLMGGVVLGAFPAGQAMRWSGRYRWLLLLGLPTAIIGFALMATMNAGTSPGLLVLYTVIVGIGLGTTFPTLLVSVQNAAQARDIGVATASVGFFRSLGGAFGAAILWSILLWDLDRELAASGLTKAGLAADLLHGRAGATQLDPAMRDTVVAALAHSFHLTFLVVAGITGLALAAVVFLKDLPLRTTTHAAGNREIEPL